MAKIETTATFTAAEVRRILQSHCDPGGEAFGAGAKLMLVNARGETTELDLCSLVLSEARTL